MNSEKNATRIEQSWIIIAITLLTGFATLVRYFMWRC